MTDSELNEAVASKLGKDQAGYLYPEIPSYSTSIEAAWEIVEKQDFCKLIKAATVFRCKLGENYPGVEAYGDTAPRAICEAFLRLP